MTTPTTPETIVIRGKTFIPDAGSHQPDGKACVMELVSYMAGEKWSDHPKCTSPVIGAFARTFWDRTPKTWQGLLDRAERIAGSATTREVDRARGYLAADRAVRRFAPRWLRRAGLEEDAVALEALAPVTDEASAKTAYNAGAEIRQRAYDRRDAALAKLRRAAGAAGAAWAAWAAGAAGAAEAAGAAGAAEAAWAAGLKGKTYDEMRAWVRQKIKAALADEIEASIDDGFALLDAMLALEAVPASVVA